MYAHPLTARVTRDAKVRVALGEAGERRVPHERLSCVLGTESVAEVAMALDHACLTIEELLTVRSGKHLGR